MAQLIMSNGKVQIVSYDQAAKIYQILLGNAKPRDQVQQEFCDEVSEVQFDALPTIRVYTKRKNVERDPKMHQILTDHTLTGYNKFKAVADRLRERTTVPE